MTDGLNKQLVRANFWPSCQSCVHFTHCRQATEPKHPAFPHNWHWWRDAIEFPDGVLVIDSWVGSTVKGEAHTGCYDFSVELDYLILLSESHQHYLQLRFEYDEIDKKLRSYELRGVDSPYVVSLYERSAEVAKQMRAIAAGEA